MSNRAGAVCTPSQRQLFQAFSDRYEQASLIVTSNLAFAQWTSVSGEASLAAALLATTQRSGRCSPRLG